MSTMSIAAGIEQTVADVAVPVDAVMTGDGVSVCGGLFTSANFASGKSSHFSKPHSSMPSVPMKSVFFLSAIASLMPRSASTGGKP